MDFNYMKPKPVSVPKEGEGSGQRTVELVIFQWLHDNDIHIHSDKVEPLFEELLQIALEALPKEKAVNRPHLLMSENCNCECLEKYGFNEALARIRKELIKRFS